MGRRALRKIDPALDLSRHLKTFDELPRPWNAVLLFDRDAPLEVEVGTGKGLFLHSAARAVPEHNFLGSEIAHKYARFAAARLAKHSLPNAVVVDGDAQRLFTELFPDDALTAVHVYFPDPWWKKRHHKRRVMNERFVQAVARTLAPGGALHFWTDVRDYFDSTIAILNAQTSFIGPLDVTEHEPEHDLDYRTHFERRTRLGGERVFRARFHKS